jgi:hypothetical protein
MHEQKFLIKQVYESIFYNVTGSNRVELASIGLVASWLFYFQRSDANLRNEWSNYTNWPYSYLPNDLIQAPTTGQLSVTGKDVRGEIVSTTIGPGVNPNGLLTGLMLSPLFNIQNQKEILIKNRAFRPAKLELGN